jgi:hypothetical protein
MDRHSRARGNETPSAAVQRRAIRLAIAVIVLMFSATLAPSVAAAAPIVEPLVDGGSEVVPCSGFDAEFSRTFTGRITVFVSDAGEPTRIQIVAQMTGTLENLSTHEVLPLRGAVTVTIDLVGGTTAFTGNVLIGTRMGDGSVLKDIGRFVVDAADDIVLMAGPHDLISSGPDALCEAVA